MNAKEIQNGFYNVGSIGTYKRYKTFLLKLERYLKRKDLKFSEIDVTFLTKYENYLKTMNFKSTTVYNNMKTIRAIYYKAMAERICSPEKNPFALFKLKVDTRTKKERLTIPEIQKVEQVKLEKGSLLWNVRNCFLFSFYCAGIRISDLLQLRWVNIVQGNRLEYKMEKTGTYKSIPLIPKAKKLLALYRNEENKPVDYIFPLIPKAIDRVTPLKLYNQISAKTALINKYLKKLGEAAKIDKPLTTHIARHSFSDIGRKQKANLYDSRLPN